VTIRRAAQPTPLGEAVSPRAVQNFTLACAQQGLTAEDSLAARKAFKHVSGQRPCRTKANQAYSSNNAPCFSPCIRIVLQMWSLRA